MKTTAYWLTICAITLTIVALWVYHSEQANASPVCSRETPCRIV